MTESAFTRKLLRALRSHVALRDCAYIVKHNDASTGGIPDFSITIGRMTLWVEVKIYPNKLTRLQAYTMDRIGLGGITIIVSKDGKSALIHPLECPRLLGRNNLVEEIVQRCSP